MTPIPPLRGPWTELGFPPEVTLFGRKFKRAWFEAPYEGVKAQYREDVPKHSMHLMVYPDRTFEIAHIDRWNPDHGHLFKHLLWDILFP